MFVKIKNSVEKEISGYIRDLDELHSLSKISPLLFNNIRQFLLRKGKRIRPILLVIGYLGFTRRPAPGLYRSAVSLELLHDFMLVHDDIIDKSSTRRGEPSMHIIFDKYLTGNKFKKFNGQDLAIVAGDVMYAMALHAFLSIQESPARKERALKKLIEAALYTGSGEFIELLTGLKNIDEVRKNDIYRIYDLKTANYTFASPLGIGATLAGASPKEISKLFNYGMLIGRAFQIKDDIIGIFSEEDKIGKPNLTDIKEGKITLLIWQAFRRSARSDREIMKRIFSRNDASLADLKEIRRISSETGALSLVKDEVERLIEQSEKILKGSRIKPAYKIMLSKFAKDTLSL